MVSARRRRQSARPTAVPTMSLTPAPAFDRPPTSAAEARRVLLLLATYFGAQLEMFAQTDERRRRLTAVLDKMNADGRNPLVRHGHHLGRRD